MLSELAWDHCSRAGGPPVYVSARFAKAALSKRIRSPLAAEVAGAAARSGVTVGDEIALTHFNRDGLIGDHVKKIRVVRMESGIES